MNINVPLRLPVQPDSYSTPSLMRKNTFTHLHHSPPLPPPHPPHQCGARCACAAWVEKPHASPRSALSSAEAERCAHPGRRSTEMRTAPRTGTRRQLRLLHSLDPPLSAMG